MNVVKRTFDAKNYPKGSQERDALNQDALTSEYMTSYKYCIRNDDGSKTQWFFPSKAEAVSMAGQLEFNARKGAAA